MKKDVKFTVLYNKEISGGNWLIRFKPVEKLEERFIKSISAGQFCEVSLGLSDPLLRRPFGIVRVGSEGEIDLSYKVVGKGTEIMTEFYEGKMVKILLPLGNKFKFFENKKAIIVVGGIGVAPTIKLIEELKARKSEIYYFYGASNKENLIFAEEIKKNVTEMYIATDDGSAGEKGFITNQFQKFITEKNAELSDYVMYACGPTPLLMTLSDISKIKKIESYLSFESKMACGFGLCAGCAIKVKDKENDFKYVRVCKEGAIFKGSEVMYEY